MKVLKILEKIILILSVTLCVYWYDYKLGIIFILFIWANNMYLYNSKFFDKEE